METKRGSFRKYGIEPSVGVGDPKGIVMGSLIYLVAALILFAISVSFFVEGGILSISKIPDLLKSSINSEEIYQYFMNPSYAQELVADDDAFTDFILSVFSIVSGIVEFVFLNRMVRHLIGKRDIVDWMLYLVASFFCQIALQISLAVSEPGAYISYIFGHLMLAVVRLMCLYVLVMFLKEIIPALFGKKEMNGDAWFNQVFGTAMGFVSGYVLVPLLRFFAGFAGVVFCVALMVFIALIPMYFLTAINLGYLTILVPVLLSVLCAEIIGKINGKFQSEETGFWADAFYCGVALLCFAVRCWLIVQK